jgi:hypothetical protein
MFIVWTTFCDRPILARMGMGVTVYGFIDTPFIDESDLEKYRRNRIAIAAIPADDPKLCILRGMFNVPRFIPTKPQATIPHYDAAPIAFAANYKEMPRLPANWVIEFEAILKTLYWFQAVAMNDFSGIRYEWRMDSADAHDPDKPGGYKLKCSAGKEEELPYDVAIEGDYPA